MVKGVARQVIVVQSPDPELFEQAIFIVRSRAVDKGGVSEDQLLQQARKAAGRYWEGSVSGRGQRRFLRRFAGVLLGGAAVGVCWLLTVLLL